MNQVQLIGRLARDIEMTQTGSKHQVLNNTLAVNRFVGGEKQTDFIPITAWNATAQLIDKYLDKGDEIGIVGNLHMNHYTNKDQVEVYQLEVIIREVFFLRKKQGDKAVQDINIEVTKV
ncbi:single-stranded DNA-binding protein [Aerococcus urinae]|nr:single-stranded DNA-binding protein [Aerococcus urinae]MCY3032243.1 single-stranded DNA-binding protein [Aerococcus urinae]MCY3037748.1 single-stranded DNA-binding protein [Aerococcus urinae]MCY3044289.1 single-stranded DNA-binding protein [Aerococcus urinae]MCY3045584.1 single-stranded DNA-binding protein [Aerococcus urinae]MCY3047744.1 single-stranded DNA-binding protein [Aerococcus urinae]